MLVTKCALGVIQERGAKIVDPKLVKFGVDEADFLRRHVEKVRATSDVSARSVFSSTATGTISKLDRLLTTGSAKAYEAAAKALQDSLAQAMKTASNARDCVFAVVRAADSSKTDPYVTLLKLDAVVEAARMRLIAGGGVTFTVLKELLPEPGKLQKALSWPDPRSISDVIMLDTNVVGAQYFENAFQVRVSPRSTSAEAELARVLQENVPLASLPAAVAAAAELDGPLDKVLETLAEDYDELQDVATAAASDPQPAGIVRRNKVAARPLVWRADGVELRVDAALADSVTVEQSPAGWRIIVTTRTQPSLGI
jgi:hypothetical protein